MKSLSLDDLIEELRDAMLLASAMSEESEVDPETIEKIKQRLVDLYNELRGILADLGVGYGNPPKEAKGEEKPALDLDLSRMGACMKLEEKQPSDEYGPVFDVVIVRAGKAKSSPPAFIGEDVLKANVAKFEGVHVYPDHGYVDRSVLEIAGWVSDVAWDDEQKAIVGKLHLLWSSPITNRVLEAFDRGNPDLFELSIFFFTRSHVEAMDGENVYVVDEIVGVRSVDIVPRGAAGGKFISKQDSEVQVEPETPGPIVAEMEAAPGPVAMAFSQTEEEQAMEEKKEMVEQPEEQVETMKMAIEEIRKELMLHQMQEKLDAALAAARLPQVAKERIREQFEGRIFEMQELTDAIAKEMEYAFTVANEISPAAPSVRVTADQVDKIEQALLATIKGEPVDGIEPVNSLLYFFAQANHIPAYNPANVAQQMVRAFAGYPTQFAINWSTIFSNVMNKAIVDYTMDEDLSVWRNIVSEVVPMRDFKEVPISRVEYYDALPLVAKGVAYTELRPAATPLGEEAVTLQVQKHGGMEVWTWEDALNDDIRALRLIPQRLGRAAALTVLVNVVNVFTSNPTMPYDGAPLFDTYDAATSSWTSSAHANAVEYQLAASSFGVARTKMIRQKAPGSNDTYIMAKPRYILVPPDLWETAQKLYASEYLGTSFEANPYKGMAEPIELPYLTSATQWFLVADPKKVPTIAVGFLNGKPDPIITVEAPNTGEAFASDSVRVKVTMVVGVAPLDHRGMLAGWGEVAAP